MASLNDFTLPAHARVWIYQSSRFFTTEETVLIQKKIDEFAASWHAHADKLSAEIKVLHNLFIVVAVDEMAAKASGCSIDKSVRLIKELENELNLTLTGRTTVAWFDAENQMQLTHFNTLKEYLQDGGVSENLVMFNNLVSTLADMREQWVVRLKDSWIMKIPA